MESLVNVLMRRENMDEWEVMDWIKEVVEDNPGVHPETLLHDEFGLEPDYLFDLIEFL